MIPNHFIPAFAGVLRCVASAAFFAAVFCPSVTGCATGGSAGGSERSSGVSFTPVETASRWITPLQVAGLDRVVVGVIDFDFSGRTVEIDFFPAAFVPQCSGVVSLTPLSQRKRVSSILALDKAMAPMRNGAKNAVIVLAGGRPVGTPDDGTSQPMLDFLSSFDSDLRLTGFDFVYIVPSRGFSLDSLPPEG